MPHTSCRLPQRAYFFFPKTNMPATCQSRRLQPIGRSRRSGALPCAARNAGTSTGGVVAGRSRGQQDARPAAEAHRGCVGGERRPERTSGLGGHVGIALRQPAPTRGEFAKRHFRSVLDIHRGPQPDAETVTMRANSYIGFARNAKLAYLCLKLTTLCHYSMTMN